MSLIGTLEQIDIKSVLQRIEIHSKTGLFVVKQGAQWVEMYFRDGRLMWVGPAHIQINLGEWFMQTGVLSGQAWQEVMHSIGGAQSGEMRVALTLIDLGYVDHDELRAWATKRASKALKTLSSWTTGEIYFEDGIVPPADHLLVALSIVALFTEPAEASKFSAAFVPPPVAAIAVASRPMPLISKPVPVVASVPNRHVSNAPTLMEPSQFFSSHAPKVMSDVLLFPDDVMANPGIAVKGSEASEVATTTATSSPMHHIPSALHLVSDAPDGEPTQLIPAAPTSLSVAPLAPIAPKRIDTSFMQPDMLLVPADLSAMHEQDAQLQLTPEQWRLLTLVDGQTTLQIACQALRMPREVVCQIAGELIAAGLIRVVSPFGYYNQVHEMQSHVREVAKGDSGSNYVTISSSGTASVGLPAALPFSDVLPAYAPPLPFATQSQWGNGANGATFVPGRGWVTSPQPLQPLQPSGPIATGRPFAYTGGK